MEHAVCVLKIFVLPVDRDEWRGVRKSYFYRLDHTVQVVLVMYTLYRDVQQQEEVAMEDLSPPDHTGPPSLGRVSRRLR